MLHRLSAGGVVILAKLKQDLAAVIDLHRAEWLAASPATLRGLVEGRRSGASRMRSLEVVEAVGSVMPAVLAGRVRSELCANLYANYGSTETGTIASGPLQDSADLPGGTSRLLEGVVVESLGDDDRPLPRGSTGRLRVRTPGMAHRYEGDDAASERAFRDGWFLPGDLGAVTGDSILVVTGRIDDLINVGGNKISPQVIEDALLRVPGVTDAAAVGIRDASGCTGIGVAIVADDRATPAALDDACKRLRYMAPSRILRLDELPRNENGKVDREDIARRM
jgi:acyl-coenzyme A synthetase/AMP-(fatty) acid ligase